jgi:4-hydroxybenzoate polyprenyltransferase
MRIISSKLHGVLDYGVGMLLIIIPWLAGFAQGGAETWVPVSLGVAALLYSLFTNYELGRIKVLSFRVHLVIDFLSGMMLAASPWLFGFKDQVYIPHLVLGLLEIVVVLMSVPVAYYSKTIEARNKAARPAHSQ